MYVFQKERGAKCWNEECVLSPIFSGNYNEIASKIKSSKMKIIEEKNFSKDLLQSKRIRTESLELKDNDEKEIKDNDIQMMSSHVLGKNSFNDKKDTISNYYYSAEEKVIKVKENKNEQDDDNNKQLNQNKRTAQTLYQVFPVNAG